MAVVSDALAPTISMELRLSEKGRIKRPIEPHRIPATVTNKAPIKFCKLLFFIN